jgi:hypothetical protein
MDGRPVLYLDIDDTLISWEGGRPRAAPGARDFVVWALEHFDVRWLTTWCPEGEMAPGLLHDLCRMLDLPSQSIARIRGIPWDRETSKLNGIAWLEHLVLGRPFIWLEDEHGFQERERTFMVANQQLHCYRHCNVTVDPSSLVGVHSELRRWLRESSAAAA